MQHEREGALFYNYFVYLPSIILFGTRIKMLNWRSVSLTKRSHYFDINFGASSTSTKTIYIQIIAQVYTYYVFN
jgi:hypothetical protein